MGANLLTYIINLLIAFAPTLILFIFVFVMFSWIRVLIDKLSGKGI